MRKCMFCYLLLMPIFAFGLSVNIGNLKFEIDQTSMEAKVVQDFNFSSDYGNVSIPKEVEYDGKTYTVTSIDIYAFAGRTGLYSIIIPNSVKSVGFNAFSGCSNLVSVTIGNGLEFIDGFAFKDCNSLTSITVPNNVISIGGSAFEGCKALVSINIPNSVESIGSYCFRDCTNLESVTMGSNVTNIENETFYNCSKLASITIPSSVTSIGVDAFHGCTNLGSITIENGLKSIYPGAFSGCTSLTSITIPESVTAIGTGAFGCNALTDLYWYTDKVIIIVGNELSNTTLHVHDNLIEDYKYAWQGFKAYKGVDNTDFKLKYYVDGEDYKTVNYKYGESITPETEPTKKGMTFSGWSKIPETMPGKDIDVKGTFSYSKETTDGVTYQVTDADNELAAVIGNDNASGEVKIADEVEFDDGTYKATKIADNAFNGQNAITAFEIGKNVTTIGERAFANNNKLNDVYCYAEEVPETDRTAFENSYIDYVTLHVPAGAVDKYKAVGPWKDFKEVVAIAATGDQKCATPTIKFENGKIKFACETEGVKFRYQITNADVKSSDGAEVELGGVYNVRVYALKEGLRDSEAATMEIKLPTVKGDLNDDRMVDVKDHVVLSNIIMNTQEEEAEVEQEETE